MVTFKRYVPNEDMEAWMHVQNVAKKGMKDVPLLSKERMQKVMEAPTFDPEGMLFAILDGNPIGCVDAYMDKKHYSTRGVILDLAILPEWRRKGFGA